MNCFRHIYFQESARMHPWIAQGQAFSQSGSWHAPVFSDRETGGIIGLQGDCYAATFPLHE
jgi:purine nucleoside permease